MNFVFFETGNDEFFLKLMEVFCLNYVENITDFYNSMKKEYDAKWWDGMKEHFTRKNFDIFSCAQHLRSTNCPHRYCKAKHTTVLANDQRTIHGDTLHKTQSKYAKDNFPGTKKKTWRDIQGIFEYHGTAKIVFGLEFLPPFTSNTHDEYLDKYIIETNKKTAACYYYVRARDRSDYTMFMGKTELPNVVACDALQSVV